MSHDLVPGSDSAQMMALAARTTKRAIAAYRAVCWVQLQATAKRDALYKTNPVYAVFDYGTSRPCCSLPQHATAELRLFEQFVSGVVDWPLDRTGSVSDELNRICAQQTAKGAPVDSVVYALRSLESKPLRVADAVRALLACFLQSISLVDCVEPAHLKGCWASRHGNKNVARYLGPPLVPLLLDCDVAVAGCKGLHGRCAIVATG